jgi:hypothetical protein
MPPPSKPKGRKRAIIKSALVAFIVIGAWIGALIWWQSRKGEGYAFRKETQEVMEMIRDGKGEQLYTDADPQLQGRMIEQRFLEKCTLINQTLGAFKDIKSTHDHGIDDSSSGRTGYVSARLQFERAETTVSLGFKWDAAADRWRLLSFHFDIPEALRGNVPAPELAKPKREAPSEVVELTRTTLQRLAEGKVADVYAGAHPYFKSAVTLDRFVELVEKRTREMGKFVRIIDFTKTGKNERVANQHAWVTAVIEYTRATTTGSFDFINDDGTWRLSTFKIDIPPPEVPTRPELDSEPGPT